MDLADYPTADELDQLEQLPPAEALDRARSLWRWLPDDPERLQGCELEIIRAEFGSRYLRLATGGWSGNEAIIVALRRNGLTWSRCWRLALFGGLYIFEYPHA